MTPRCSIARENGASFLLLPHWAALPLVDVVEHGYGPGQERHRHCLPLCRVGVGLGAARGDLRPPSRRVGRVGTGVAGPRRAALPPRLRVDPEGVARERNDANDDGRNHCLSHDNYNSRVLSPAKIGMATMAPERCTVRPRGASLSRAKCVRTSL
jgi:hypothetical protein